MLIKLNSLYNDHKMLHNNSTQFIEAVSFCCWEEWVFLHVLTPFYSYLHLHVLPEEIQTSVWFLPVPKIVRKNKENSSVEKRLLHVKKVTRLSCTTVTEL